MILRFRKWDLRLFKKRIDGQWWYFVASWEVHECRMSCTSYWDAFERLRPFMDHIDGLVENDAPF